MSEQLALKHSVQLEKIEKELLAIKDRLSRLEKYKMRFYACEKCGAFYNSATLKECPDCGEPTP